MPRLAPRCRLSAALLCLALLPSACGATGETVAPTGLATTPIPAAPLPSPAETKFWQAIKLLEGGRSADLPTARAMLKEAADLGYSHAQVLLGNCLLSGSYDFKRDARKGAGLFRLAASRGNAYAQVSLGQCYFSGRGVGKDTDKAAQLLEAAVRPDADYSRPVPPSDALAPAPRPGTSSDTAGEFATDQASSTRASAHFLLGLIAQQQKDQVRAHPHFEAAATAGHSGLYQAAIQTALDYAFGQGIARDMAKATAMLELSRKLGVRASLSSVHSNVALKIANDLASAEFEEELNNAMARNQEAIQLGIARSLADPKSKDYNLREAVKWYEVAAESGQAWAMLSLAFIYSRGELGQPEPEKAFAWFEKAGSGEKPKHSLATTNLAICLHNGFGVAKDADKAAALFKKNRDSSMLCYLGSIGQYPSKVATYEEEKALTESRAAQGDGQALYLLGRRHAEGWDGPRDLKKAEDYFKRAAQTGHAAAQCNLGVLYEFNSEQFGFKTKPEALRKAYECYQQSAAQNNTAAMANVANILRDGWFGKRDADAAEALYERCLQLEPDHARALYGIGLISEKRLRTVVRAEDAAQIQTYRQKTLQNYEASARLGYAYASWNLGSLYDNGNLFPPDYQLAYRYYTDAAEHGITELHYRLGQMHELGQGVPVTLDEATYHYRLAALNGNIVALRRLCDLYLGAARDLDRAAFWLSLLAQRGDHQALMRYGDVLFRKGDYAEAFTFYSVLSKKAGPIDAGVACQHLALLYENGWGVTKDQRRAQSFRRRALDANYLPALHDEGMAQLAKGDKRAALAMLEQASTRGFGPSKYQLACLYRREGGSSPDRIARLLGSAALDGCAEAQIELARKTLNGLPGAPSLEDAIRMAGDAAQDGNAEATNLKRELEARLPSAPAVPEEESAKARSG